MVDKIPTVTVVMVVVLVIALTIDGGAGSPVQPRQSLALAQASALGGAGQHHRRSRSIVGLIDPSCKGYYDRGILNTLSYVCEDCDNLYREFGFQAKCRSDCFASDLFTTCLVALGKNVEEYLAMAASVRGS